MMREISVPEKQHIPYIPYRFSILHCSTTRWMLFSVSSFCFPFLDSIAIRKLYTANVVQCFIVKQFDEICFSHEICIPLNNLLKQTALSVHLFFFLLSFDVNSFQRRIINYSESDFQYFTSIIFLVDISNFCHPSKKEIPNSSV